jgi:hypothetical protein
MILKSRPPCFCCGPFRLLTNDISWRLSSFQRMFEMIHSFIAQQYTQWISHVAIVEWGSYYPTKNSCGAGSFLYTTDHDRLLLTTLPPVMRRLTSLHAVFCLQFIVSNRENLCCIHITEDLKNSAISQPSVIIKNCCRLIYLLSSLTTIHSFFYEMRLH